MLIDEAPATADRGSNDRRAGQQQRAGGGAIKSLRMGVGEIIAAKAPVHRSDSSSSAISRFSCQARPSSAWMLILAGTVIGKLDAKLMLARALAPGGQERAFSRSKFARRRLHARGEPAVEPSHSVSTLAKPLRPLTSLRLPGGRRSSMVSAPSPSRAPVVPMFAALIAKRRGEAPFVWRTRSIFNSV